MFSGLGTAGKIHIKIIARDKDVKISLYSHCTLGFLQKVIFLLYECFLSQVMFI